MSDLSLSQSLFLQGSSIDALGINLAPISANQKPSKVTLDDLIIIKPLSTVIYPVRELAATQYGLKLGDLLIVDRAAIPQTNQLVITSTNDVLAISRYSEQQSPYQSNCSEVTDHQTNLLFIWGAVTYIISKQS